MIRRFRHHHRVRPYLSPSRKLGEFKKNETKYEDGNEPNLYTSVELYRGCEIKADIKRNPEKVKICADNDYHEILLITRSGGVCSNEYGNVEFFPPVKETEILRKERISLGHTMITPQDFYDKCKNEKDKYLSTIELFLNEFDKKLKLGDTHQSLIPIKVFVKTENEKLKCFHDYIDDELEYVTIPSGTFKYKYLDDITEDDILLFPQAPVVKKKGAVPVWIKQLYRIVRDELEQKVKEVWFCFKNIDDAIRTYMYIVGNTLNLEKIIYCS